MKYAFENFIFDVDRNELFVDDELAHVEPQVCRLIELLIANNGNIVTRDEIQREIWDDRIVMPSVIDNRIRAARNVLNDDGKSQRLIKTFPNVGYKFVGEVVEHASDAKPEKDIEALPDLSNLENGVKFKNGWSRFKLASLAISVFAALIFIGIYLFIDRNPANPENENIVKSPRNSLSYTVAVLPFTTGVELDNKVGNAISHKTISALSRIKSLGVVSAQSSFQVDKTKLSTQGLARALEADFILDGIVTSDANSFNVTAQLVSAEEDKVVWSETFHKGKPEESRLIFETETAKKVTIKVANFLGSSISSEAKFLVDKDVFLKYQTGLDLLNSEKSEDMKQAIALFAEVVQKEPNFVPAYMYYSEAVDRALKISDWSRTDAIRDVSIYAEKVSMLSPDSPETYLTQGNLAKIRSDADKAVEYYDKALKKNPNFALGYFKKAKVLFTLYDLYEALYCFKKVLSLNPLSSDVVLNIAEVQFSLGNIEEAMRLTKRSLLWSPENLSALINAGRYELGIGHYDESLNYLNAARRLNRDNFDLQFNTYLLYNNLGLLDELNELIDNPGLKATVAALKGDAETAYKLTKLDPFSWTSPYVQYLLGDSRELYEMFVKMDLSNSIMTRKNSIPIDQTLDVVFMLDLFIMQNDDKSKALIERIGKDFDKKSVTDIKILEEFSAVAGYYSIIGKNEKALEVLDEANRQQMIFLSRLKVSPIFKNLREHPGFETRLKTMTENRDLVLSSLKQL